MSGAGPAEPRRLAAPILGIIDEQRLALEKFFAAGAHGLVEVQQALDWHGRERLLAWEQEGLPPTVWTLAHFRIGCPVGFSCRPKGDAAGGTRLAIAPRHAGRGGLTLGVRYVPTLHDAGDDSDEA